MKSFLLIFGILFSMTYSVASPICTTNTEFVVSDLQSDTEKMLKKEKKNLKKAVKAYKEALEKKKKMMMILWKTTTEIEFVMKENHILRKRIMKHWENVRHSPSDVHSF